MDYKRELTIGVFLTLILLSLILHLRNQYLQVKPTTKKPMSNIKTTGENPVLTLAEISKHNNSDSCWLIIENKVYDVTKFLDQHPAGPGIIANYCGREATVAFNTQDGAGQHSPQAKQTLQTYYLGNLAK
jgi:cytochrome b involved in lipid metabolism